jgi:hypothetical protein
LSFLEDYFYGKRNDGWTPYGSFSENEFNDPLNDFFNNPYEQQIVKIRKG